MLTLWRAGSRKSSKAGRQAHRKHPKEYAVKVNVRVEIYCRRGRSHEWWEMEFQK